MKVLYLNKGGLDPKMESLGSKSFVYSAKLSSEELPEPEILQFWSIYQGNLQEIGSYSIKICIFCSLNLDSIATSYLLNWSPKKTTI